MKVLVIDEWIPWPLESGKKIRSFQLLKPLTSKHEITYLCHANQLKEADKVAKMKEAGFKMVCVNSADRFRSTASLAAGVASNFFLRNPLSVRKHYSRHFKQAFQRLIAQETFDLVHYEWTHYAQYMQIALNCPSFLCSHNVENMSWKRFAEVQTNLFRKAIIHLEYAKMKRFEHRVIPCFDHVAAVSHEDAKIMRTLFGAKSVDVIPNGVDTSFYKDIFNNSDDTNIIYCASMDAYVNQDAAIYFANNILPIIHEQKPHVKFMIVGRNPPISIRNLANDRIVVTGSVDDVRPWLAKASISVVPLRVGGGSRLKILEAFASMSPVVSTTIGCEGLEITPDSHLLVADDERNFADMCIKLLDDRPLRKKLVESARNYVHCYHDWKILSPLVESAWQQTIVDHTSKRPQVGKI